LGDERREWSLDEGGDAHDVDAALACDREVVDVEDPEIDLAGGDEPGSRIRSRTPWRRSSPSRTAA